MLSARCSAYINPEHAALISKQSAFVLPSAACTSHAHEGKFLSGVDVAHIIRSISLASVADISKAFFAASVANILKLSFSSQTYLYSIPVLDLIHSSEVSTILLKSIFDNLFPGSCEPIPVRTIPIIPPKKSAFIFIRYHCDHFGGRIFIKYFDTQTILFT